MLEPEIVTMAPSIAEIPEKQEVSSIIVPVKAATGSGETAPKVRRIIDEEEGKIPASVSIQPLTALINNSTQV